MFFCEFCKIFKNSFSYGTVLVAASYVKIVFGQTQFEYIDRDSEVWRRHIEMWRHQTYLKKHESKIKMVNSDVLKSPVKK